MEAFGPSVLIICFGALPGLDGNSAVRPSPSQSPVIREQLSPIGGATRGLDLVSGRWTMLVVFEPDAGPAAR